MGLIYIDGESHNVNNTPVFWRAEDILKMGGIVDLERYQLLQIIDDEAYLQGNSSVLDIDDGDIFISVLRVGKMCGGPTDGQ